LGYDFKRQRIVKKIFVAEKVVRAMAGPAGLPCVITAKVAYTSRIAWKIPFPDF